MIYAIAMQSISTKAPAGSPITANVALAGGSVFDYEGAI
jgi:hypothetical protein